MGHDRSARFGKLITRTPEVVGPGSYDTYEPSKPPRDLQREYPFLSGKARKTLELRKDVGSLPGPGSYDPVEPRRHGGVSIDFTETRLKPKIHEGPGPEAYNLPEDIFKIGTRKLRQHPGTWRGPGGNLYLGKPPRSIIAGTGVSVPSKRDVNGYDVKRGILVKNPPCEFEPLDFYDVPRGEANFTTLRYKGNFWSMMTGRDEKCIEERAPGPGAYETEKPTNASKMRDEEYRSLRRARSRSSRYLDQLLRRKCLEDLPAPNKYDVPKGPFDDSSTCDCDEYTIERAAFGRGAERFAVETSEAVPGPGTYDPVAAKCSSSCSKLCAPFGACAARSAARTNDSPGPGSYDLTKDDLARRIVTICRRSYARSSVPSRLEGSSGSIRHEDTASDGGVTPDPRAKKLRVHHAVFKSATSRFKDAGLRGDTPGPGCYDPSLAFKASTEPCHFARRSLTAPFASRTRRFADVPAGTDLQVPGPGIYDVRSDIAHGVKGGVVGDATGCRKTREETPGPQRYCFHPYVESSVIRRSHNVTLGKPGIIQGLKKSENSRAIGGRGKKILRWFAEPITKYEHRSIRRCID